MNAPTPAAPIPAAHALTVYKRQERDGQITHLDAVCACGAWSEAGTTSALADELLADPGLRLADRIAANHAAHVEGRPGTPWHRIADAALRGVTALDAP